MPWGTKVAYKYIVDGRWTTADGQPTETDPIGNVNNVYSAPDAPPPAPEPVSKPDEAESQGVVGTVKDTVAGLAQAATQLVEQIAPSVSTPTSAAEAPAPASDPEPTPAASEPVPEPTAEPTADPVTPTAVLTPAEVAAPQVAPDVPVHVLPLDPAPPAPTIVEGTAVASAPAAEANGEPENGPSTHEVASEPVVGAEVREKAIEGEGIVPEEKPTEETKPAINGTPEEDAKPIVNGTSEAEKPAANGTEESKPTTNGTPAPVAAETKATPTLNGTPTKPATNGSSPTTPVPASPSPSSTKEKKMRFPSLSARHSRRSSGSVTELGEAPGSPGQSKEKLDTHASRAAAGETVRRKRTSIFGKIKGIFDSPHANGHGKAASNGA